MQAHTNTRCPEAIIDAHARPLSNPTPTRNRAGFNARRPGPDTTCYRGKEAAYSAAIGKTSDADQARKRDALAASIKAKLRAKQEAKAAAQADDDLEATG